MVCIVELEEVNNYFSHTVDPVQAVPRLSFQENKATMPQKPLKFIRILSIYILDTLLIVPGLLIVLKQFQEL